MNSKKENDLLCYQDSAPPRLQVNLEPFLFKKRMFWQTIKGNPRLFYIIQNPLSYIFEMPMLHGSFKCPPAPFGAFPGEEARASSQHGLPTHSPLTRIPSLHLSHSCPFSTGVLQARLGQEISTFPRGHGTTHTQDPTPTQKFALAL